MAYSTVSREFLVAWRSFSPADIYAIRVSYTGAPLGDVFPISSATSHDDNPNIAYNNQTDEFLVVHTAFTSFSTVFGQRVKAGTSALLGPPNPIIQTAGAYITDVAYDSITGKYLAMWHQEAPFKALFGRLLNSDGTPAAPVGAISSRYAAYDALSLAYNRTAGTFFVVSHSTTTAEDGGVEIDGTATPLSTGDQITAAAGKGNYYPRIAAHAKTSDWLMSAAHDFISTIGQRLTSARRSGAPPLEDLPPPPPPPGGKVSVNRTNLTFGILAGTNTANSGAQNVAINFTQGTPNWTVSSSASFVVVSPASGTGAGTFNVSLLAGKYSAGIETAVLTVSAPGTGNVTVTIPVTIFIKSVGANPIGLIETPANNLTGVVGSIPVTGWAVDDVGVREVTLWRDPVAGEVPAANGKMFIGRAVQVEGSRPDVDLAYSLPFDFKAGWGYMLLTNMLPNQGNGTFVLHAFAEDLDGHTALLGSRTITCANASATRPFGAIDAPGQGEVASGAAYINFGWALTPQPYNIPSDGSTIVVLLDGVAVGKPTYNQVRDDIAKLFPGLVNSNGAVGYFPIDTTTLANGVHTIAWLVTDSNGSTEGIGSRYFTVLNGGSTSALTLERSFSAQALAGGGPELLLSAGPGPLNGQPASAVAGLPQSDVPVYVRTGYDPAAPLTIVDPDPQGVAVVRAAEVGRMIVTLGAPAVQDGDGYEGYQVTGDTLAPLPPGTFLDRKSGEFYWQPGVGFVGGYDLVFVHTEQGTKRRIPVAVRIGN